MATLQYIIVDEPKAARQESSFAGGQAVAPVFGFVPQNEFTIDQKSVLDRPQCAADSGVLRRKKADDRDQQEAGIEPLRTIGLHKALLLTVETALADFGMDFVGDLA